MLIAIYIGGRATCAEKNLVPQIDDFLDRHPEARIHLYMSLNAPPKSPLPFRHDPAGPRLRVLPPRIDPYEAPPHMEGHPQIPTWTYTIVQNMLSMFYHNAMATRMIVESGVPYDCVVKYRPDIVRKDLPDAMAAPDLQHGVLYFPDCNHWGGMNDQVAWGTLPTMIAYGRIHELILRDDDGGRGKLPCELHPETMILHYCTKELGIRGAIAQGYTYELDEARHEGQPKFKKNSGT